MPHLYLSDGTTFEGTSFGAPVSSEGEVVFNTGMVGYPESLTDPSYRGQILTFTFPLIGNYGVPSEELNEWGFSKNLESEQIHVRGVIVNQASEDFSHHQAVSSLGDWLKKHNIPALTGVDTRALTKKLREHGVMLGRIVQEDIGHRTSDLGQGSAESRSPNPEVLRPIQDPNVNNLVAEVSTGKVETYKPAKEVDTGLTIVAFDCGMKRNILRSLLKRGLTVVRVPWDYDLSTHNDHYDGVFCSNGPGDPKQCIPTIKSMKFAVDKQIPTFGICLGNQLLALALGGDTYKLKYGHRGANQPCVEWLNGKETDRCIITSQNHGFAVDGNKLPKDWEVWWKNGNDGTVEGVRHNSGKFFSVQFHPEATPGPEDANYLFDEFVKVMKNA